MLSTRLSLTLSLPDRLTSKNNAMTDKKTAPRTALLAMVIFGAISVLSLYLVVTLYLQQQWAFALLFLVVTAAGLTVFYSKKTYSHRYIFPSLAGMTIFVIFPLIYTVAIGFTNYSARNLLDEERVTQHHLDKTYLSEAGNLPYRLYAKKDLFELILDDIKNQRMLTTGPISLSDSPQKISLSAIPTAPSDYPLTIREIIKNKKEIGQLILITPEQHRLQMNGLRNFGALENQYRMEQPGIPDVLINNQNGDRLIINRQLGFYQTEQGENVAPGFTVTIGLDNFLEVLTSHSIRGPFLQIFTWTVLFSFLSVVFTLIIGLLLASILQWEMIQGKPFYRIMLILPYAVPAFISILVFKGLFNQNFGEINLVLQNLFGIRPDWFSDPFLARSMILIVNTWLGYPYMMLLCMGLLQAIPRDLYEASAMDGATPLDNLMNITLPLIIKPLMPLLIASFAFNFNNFVLIALLTGGSPDIIGATTPAGTTDLLVSYTYRIAFQDSGQNFALAAAIATFIFLLVGALSLLNLKLTKVKV